MSRGKEKAPHQASTRGGRFTGLPHVVQDSPAFRGLDFVSRAVLLELIRCFDGKNNGKIFISFDHLCRNLNTTNRRAIGRAFAQLVQHGFVEVMAAPDRRHHKAREYRLTWINTTAGGRHVQATEEYLIWTPTTLLEVPLKRKNTVTTCHYEVGLHSDTSSPKGVSHSDDVSLKLKNYRAKSKVANFAYGDDVSLHVINHIPHAEQMPAAGITPPPSKPLLVSGDRFAEATSDVRDGMSDPKSAQVLPNCERCGEAIPVTGKERGKQKRFCTERCQRAEERARHRRRRAA